MDKCTPFLIFANEKIFFIAILRLTIFLLIFRFEQFTLDMYHNITFEKNVLNQMFSSCIFRRQHENRTPSL